MEQEKKNCPYCGEEIMATAKKCKHCGEWLTSKKKAIKKRERQPLENAEKTDYQGIISSLRDEIRIANTEANWNEENSDALPTQVFIIGILMGIAFKSWWIGGGTILGLFILLQIPYIGTFICIILSLIYAFIGYTFGTYFFSTSAGWVIGIFVGLGTLGLNLSSKQWLKD